MLRCYHLVAVLTLLLLWAPLYAGNDKHSFAVKPANVSQSISTPRNFASNSIIITKSRIQRASLPSCITKRPGHYTITDWRDAIDSTWGPGLPKAQKLHIFDKFWGTIDSQFACFNNLEVNWDSLGNLYRNEIVNGDPTYGVSRGRFSGIMDHLASSLREAHTMTGDAQVYSSALDPGVPLMYVGGCSDNGHFGAGLTPLPDSSLLVYMAKPQHPLGLVPGDVILGYDGIPWKQLVRELLETQLPLTGMWVGSCDYSFEHEMLMAAGMNWHLFDTIDVVKYSTGDTLHLSTTPLVGSYSFYWASEQMPIEGIPIPVYPSEYVSYGIVNGTQVGYIYVNAWVGTAGTDFYNAIDDLINFQGVQALIIDFRSNYGGYIEMSNAGLGLLFRETVTTIDWAVRNDPLDHSALQSLNEYSHWRIIGDPSNIFDGPIAVLVGPGALSAGDQNALRFKFHPRARFFGKTTNTAFNAPTAIYYGDPDWMGQFANQESFIYPFSDQYLTHIEFAVDEPVWLTPDMVAQGRDDVVEAAIAWIQSTGVNEENDSAIPKNLAVRNYPNPFNAQTIFQYSLPKASDVTIDIFDILGRKIETLAEGTKPAGTHDAVWDASGQASGIYFYRVKAGDKIQMKRMTLMK